MSLLLWSIVASAFAADPRLICESRFAPRPTLRAELLATGAIEELEGERAAIVGGISRGRSRTWGARVKALLHGGRADVAVLVKASGEPVVYPLASAPRPIPPDAALIIRVPAYANTLITREGAWRWRSAPPPALGLGDTPKRIFFERYETALRQLVRVGALRAEDLCRGVVLGGVHYDHEVDVLMADPPDGRRLTVFGRGTLETARDFGENALIVLRDGRRLGWRDGRWAVMPPLGFAAEVARDAKSAEVRELATAHPGPVDQIGWQPQYSEAVDIMNARAHAVRDERSGQWYVLVDADHACFLFNPATRDWADLRDMRDETFVLPDQGRIGLNLGTSRGWRRLSPVGEFERLRALYSRGSP